MSYVRAFDDVEFDRRRLEVRRRMEAAGFDLLVCQDPANMNWLTGFDGWLFYMPQAVLVHRDEEVPIWFGRAQDAKSASTSIPTTTLPGRTGTSSQDSPPPPFRTTGSWSTGPVWSSRRPSSRPG